MRAIGIIQYTDEQITGQIDDNPNLKGDGMAQKVALEIMQSPKYQNTSLRKGMAPEVRKEVRKRLKKGL